MFCFTWSWWLPTTHGANFCVLIVTEQWTIGGTQCSTTIQWTIENSVILSTIWHMVVQWWRKTTVKFLIFPYFKYIPSCVIRSWFLGLNVCNNQTKTTDSVIYNFKQGFNNYQLKIDLTWFYFWHCSLRSWKQSFLLACI